MGNKFCTVCGIAEPSKIGQALKNFTLHEENPEAKQQLGFTKHKIGLLCPECLEEYRAVQRRNKIKGHFA